jgi:hypothetical protein
MKFAKFVSKSIWIGGWQVKSRKYQVGGPQTLNLAHFAIVVLLVINHYSYALSSPIPYINCNLFAVASHRIMVADIVGRDDG